MSKRVKWKKASQLCHKTEQVTDVKTVAEVKEAAYLHTRIVFNLHRYKPLKNRIKSHLSLAGINRSSPYSPH